MSVACPRAPWAAGVRSWLGGPGGEGLPSLPPEFAADRGFLGGWWPRGAAGGEEAESPPPETQRSPGPGWRRGRRAAGVGEDAALRAPWRRGRLRAGGWAAPRGRSPRVGERVDTKLRAALLLAGHTPECRSNRRRRDCGKPREAGKRRVVGVPPLSQPQLLFSVFMSGASAPHLSWVAPVFSPTPPPHCHIAFPCGSPLIFSPTFHPLLLG